MKRNHCKVASQCVVSIIALVSLSTFAARPGGAGEAHWDYAMSSANEDEFRDPETVPEHAQRMGEYRRRLGEALEGSKAG